MEKPLEKRLATEQSSTAFTLVTHLHPWCVPTTASKKLDHTFVYCPENKKYFGCWNGGHIEDKDAIAINVSCYGRSMEEAYPVANCYRGRKDSAKIGIYGINGVCHQSTNCFLVPTKKFMIPTGPKKRPGGYYLSVGTYGFYGTKRKWWLKHVFEPCAKGHNMSFTSADSNDYFSRLWQLYEQIDNSPTPVSSIEERMKEFEFFVDIHELDLAPELYRETLRKYVTEIHRVLDKASSIDEVITSISAKEINEVNKEFQLDLAKAIGTENFEALTNQKVGEVIDILDPGIYG